MPTSMQAIRQNPSKCLGSTEFPNARFLSRRHMDQLYCSWEAPSACGVYVILLSQANASAFLCIAEAKVLKTAKGAGFTSVTDETERTVQEPNRDSKSVETEQKLCARSKLLLLTDDRDKLQVTLKAAGISAAEEDLASWHRI